MLEFLSTISGKKGGIWKYADFYAEKIEPEHQLSLGDGNTPLEEDAELARRLGLEQIYYKREDLNASGSIKGRSLGYQVSAASQRGDRALVISTSGNAGIAAAAYARKAGLKAFVFISPETEAGKVVELLEQEPIVIRSRRAMRLAGYAAAKYRLPNLRPSLDDASIEGFMSLAFELAEADDRIDAVFTYVTSGSSLLGLGRGFDTYLKLGKIRQLPRLFAVQSGEIASVASEFEDNRELIAVAGTRSEGQIRAGALGTRSTRRKQELLDLLGRTGGSGIFVSEDEIAGSRALLTDKGITTSLEGCASLAALRKTPGADRFRRPVVIFSGKMRAGISIADESKLLSAESFEEVDKIIMENLR